MNLLHINYNLGAWMLITYIYSITNMFSYTI
ncbi:hypothetical protein [Staphylococcus phage vB_SauM-V1SA19]|nr:hypothetical protein [Staphylococcus phage vB_SauM-V1SA19]